MPPAPALRSVPAPGRGSRSRALPCLPLFVLLALAGAPAGADPVADPPAADAPAAEEPDARAGDDAPDASPPAPPLLRVPEVTISTTRTEVEVLDVPGNVTVLDRPTIERSGARDVPDLLRREAGIFVTNTTTNPEGYTVEARGFNNGGGNGSGTLVLVNGRRVNEPNGGVADWSFIPIDEIERIEVVRGPVSTVHGDNAMAGVIHLITRHPEQDGVRATLRGRTGTYDTDAGSALLEGKAGGVSASAFLDGLSTDGYRERSGFRAHTGDLDLRFDLAARGRLALQGGYASTMRQRPGDLTRAEMALDRRQAEPGSGSNFDDARQRWLQAILDLDVGEHVSVRLQPFHRRRTDRSEILDPFSEFTASIEQDAAGLNSQVEFAFDVLGRPNRLLVGGDLLQEDVDNDSLFVLIDPFFGNAAFPSRSASRRKLWSVFVHDELALTDALLLSLGVRRDRARYEATDRLADREFENRYTAWSPRGALTWRVREWASLYASYARGFRFPNQDEAFGFFGIEPGLEPQKSDSWETGVKIRTDCLTLNAAAYTMNVEDEILFNPLAPNPFFLPFVVLGRNVNLDRTRHRGLELFASVRPVEWLELYGSYTFDDVKVTRDGVTGLEGLRLPITPRHRGTAGVRVLLPFGFEAGVNANYVGSRTLANDLTNSIERLPRFASYDARLAWRREIAAWLTLELEGVAYNVTNRRYTEFGGFSSFEQVAGLFPSPDRHYLVGVRLVVRR
jgi:iron complex outermembrane receptor protein